MSNNVINILGEILQAEYTCELAALPNQMIRSGAEFQISTEKLYHLKDGFLSEFVDAESEEFMLMFLDTLRIFKCELERMDTMSEEFCMSYLEALKPAEITSSFGFEETKNIKTGRKNEDGLYEVFQSTPNHKSRRGNLPKSSTNILKKWLFDHLFHPYPTEEEKSQLSLQTGLNLNQISNWFINARRRTLQPMLENVRQTGCSPEMDGESEAHSPPPKRNNKRRIQRDLDDE